jgi:hypothetical protein
MSESRRRKGLLDAVPESDWRIGPDSADGDNCVMIRDLSGGAREVGDSKDPDGPTLVFTAGEWKAFVDGLRGGRLRP